MRWLSKLYRHTWSERLLLLEASLLVGLFRLGVVFLPFKTVQRWAANPVLKVGSSDPDYRRKVVWAVRAIARRTLGDKPCLPQALAAQWMLRRAGYAATLRIGVNRDEAGKLQAHAWLENGREIIIGGRFSPRIYRSLKPVNKADT